jgi:hypothetical protein
VILPAVLYSCGSLSVALREDRRLRVLEDGVPRRVLEVRGVRIKFHNVVLHNLWCSSTNIIIVIIQLSRECRAHGTYYVLTKFKSDSLTVNRSLERLRLNVTVMLEYIAT